MAVTDNDGRPICARHERLLVYAAYADEQMVGERLCPECEAEEEQWQEYKRLHPDPPKRVRQRDVWEAHRG